MFTICCVVVKVVHITCNSLRGFEVKRSKLNVATTARVQSRIVVVSYTWDPARLYDAWQSAYFITSLSFRQTAKPSQSWNRQA